MGDDARAKVREIASEHLARGDVVGWFDVVYERAGADAAAVPWADLAPNAALVGWLAENATARGRALVVGCGLGDDAEELAREGRFDVTAFDVAAKAVAWARERFSGSRVRYEIGDVLAPPAAWRGAFDLVFEAYTLQSLPPAERARAMAGLPRLLAPGGALLVVARVRDDDQPAAALPPWPLTAREIASIATGDVALESSAIYVDPSDGVRRARAVFRRRERA